MSKRKPKTSEYIVKLDCSVSATCIVQASSEDDALEVAKHGNYTDFEIEGIDDFDPRSAELNE